MKMFRRFKNATSIFTLLSLVLSIVSAGGKNVMVTGLYPDTQSGTDVGSEFTQIENRHPGVMFEENKGQTDPAVKFVSRGPGYTLYLSGEAAEFALKVPTVAEEGLHDKFERRRKETRSDKLSMRFVGSNKSAKVSGVDETITKTNYYIGRKRIENLSNYSRVTYERIYDGVDAVFYGNSGNQLEYDLTVAPNAKTDQIRLGFKGVTSLRTNERGELIAQTANTQLVQQKPVAYQIVDGAHREVAVAYRVDGDEVGFELGDYDPSIPLTIDPALSYLTYIGGTAFDQAFEIATDASFNTYITGTTASLDFHGETRSDADEGGVFVAKINPAGTQFLYITILEGTGEDTGFGIAVDSNNEAFVSGVASRNFPTTSGAFDTVHGVVNEEDAFVAKLNSSGNISYCSYLGGTDSDIGFDIAIDGGGKAYVVGTTRSATAFPKKNEFQGCGFAYPNSTNSFDAFLTVFNAVGSDVTYSTCFGGGGGVSINDDDGFSVAVDGSNNAYITGMTNAGNMPTKNAAQTDIAGGLDAYVAKFNPSASGDESLVYSTFLGGSGTDKGLSIAVTSNGIASVTGITGSLNFPLKNAFDATNQINEAFVTQFSATGTLLNSTFLGGADQDEGDSIAVGNGGTVYVSGSTLSNNFQTAIPFQAARRGLRDAFVVKIRFGVNSNPGVASGSFLGGNGDDTGFGIAVRGNFIFLSGNTQSNNLLTTSGVIKATSAANATNADGFVAKILDTRKDTIGTFDPVNTNFDLRNTLTPGAADITVDRGVVGDVGVSGDFNGDGIDTVSTFNNGVWKISNVNNIVSGYPVAPFTANFGQSGDLPIVGDWNNDGIDTLGVYRPSAGQFLLSNTPITSNNLSPAVNLTQTFGVAEDLPIAGDWDANGEDSVGVFRPSVGQFFLTNDSDSQFPAINTVAFFGTNGDLPVGGDWDGDGKDSIGVWRPSTLQFFLSNDNGTINNQFVFGAAGDRPVVGDWDGKPNQ